MTHAHDEDENELGWVTLNPQIEAKAYEAAREAYRDAPHAPLYAAIATYLSASQEAAAPSEEPVAWMVRSANYPLEYFSDEGSADIWANSPGVLDSVVTPLFASPAVAPVAVSVKPLPWYEGEARTGFGSSYAVHVRADGMYEATGCGSFVGGPHATREAAQSAAQSDFNARILSSIIPATKGGEGELHAFVAAHAIERKGRLAAEKALRNIAEGNLGDAPWQANYDKIRAAASRALSQDGEERS